MHSLSSLSESYISEEQESKSKAPGAAGSELELHARLQMQTVVACPKERQAGRQGKADSAQISIATNS